MKKTPATAKLKATFEGLKKSERTPWVQKATESNKQAKVLQCRSNSRDKNPISWLCLLLKSALIGSPFSAYVQAPNICAS